MYFVCAALQASAIAVAQPLPCDVVSHPLEWTHVGPAGYVDMDAQPRIASAGAAQAAVRIDNATAWLLATANGGIWKTNDLLASNGPHWQQVLDGQPVACSSISTMEASGATILAGCGASTSSEMGWDWDVANSGDWGGVMVSHDSGATWVMTSFPANYYMTALHVYSPSLFVVAARSHLHNRDDGGVWVTNDGGASWKRTLTRPVYDLTFEPSSGALLAAIPWVPDDQSVMMSKSGGQAADWTACSLGITWDGRVNFYPTFAMGGSTIFLGALTVNPSVLSDTASAIFSRSLSDLLRGDNGGTEGWRRVAGGPARLDLDGMPKDRMALLVHPHDESTLFVAGNVMFAGLEPGVFVEQFCLA